jgi:hypothetical protein
MLIIYHETIKFVNTNFEIAKNEKNISNFFDSNYIFLLNWQYD